MVSTRPKGKYTYADYFATPEGERWELIDGVLHHMAAAPSVPSINLFPATCFFCSAVISGRTGWGWCMPRLLQ